MATSRRPKRVVVQQPDDFVFDPGRLRDHVTVLHQVATVDESGAAVTWAEYFQTDVCLDPMMATDVIRSGQQVAQVSIPVIARYNPLWAANQQVRGRNGTYTVRGIVNHGGRNKWLTLECVALGDQE